MASTEPVEAIGGECIISGAVLLHILQGVAIATKTIEPDTLTVSQWISLRAAESIGLSLGAWKSAIAVDLLAVDEDSRQLANLTLAVGFLRENCRYTKTPLAGTLSSSELAQVWELIYGAITAPLSRPFFRPSRSAQGFLAVPLCSILKDGNIDELYRLHVWLPDGERGFAEAVIHSHQPFAQSWILAGEGIDHSYKVERATDPALATHAEFALSWDAGKKLDKKYETHQLYSIVENTDVLAQVTPTGTSRHTRGMTYSIPEGVYHSTEVLPDICHATLFFFDSQRGYIQDARVMGSRDAESYIQLRDPAGITAVKLAGMVESLRLWEMYMAEAQEHARSARWEHALRLFNSALHLCESEDGFPNPRRYRHIVQGELGNTNRRFGRYEQAKDILEATLAEMELGDLRVEMSGELGVIYRHMDRLEDAKRAFESQYETAKQLNPRATCRAIGNLAMVNFQLSQQDKDDSLLKLAIEQLLERVTRARQLIETIDSEPVDAVTRVRWKKDASTWETIGLSRLSLCYSASGNTKEAVKVALESLNNTLSSKDSTVIAYSRLLYGRALLLDGQRDEALKQFNPPRGCTPAMAICKEPSEEHLGYLRELVDASADMDLVDEQGYTALDYAIFNSDSRMEMLVLEGLRRNLGGDIEGQLAQRQAEARLRKGYRELFQEKLRPVLLGGDGPESLQNVRRVYADALAADETQRNTFDVLKSLRFTDFLKFGKLPRSSDNLAQPFIPGHTNADDGHGFIIFFSYRWINKDPEAISPDDANNTQYKRMVTAAEQFLKHHPSVDRAALRIWVDYACVDQDNPMRGVSALPMIIAQTNAVISLVDGDFYDRAWVSVETQMIQTLKRSYNMYQWYEHVPSGHDEWSLQEGPMGLKIDMAQTKLTFESDRIKVMFLDKQSQLLG